MKRFGTVLVFKRGVTKKQAEEALQKIQDILDDHRHGREVDGKWVNNLFHINEFDDKMGGPVWYLP